MTSADVAGLLGVAQATVKRWADAGYLPCDRTAGQHRRFQLEDIERFRETQALGAASSVGPWIDILLSRADIHAVHARLLSDRARLGSWHAVATGLAPVLVEIGQRWQTGAISVIEEHIASELLSRALARCAEAIPIHSGGTRVLLATAEDEEHTLGLALVELVAREANATTLWAGEPTPTSALVKSMESGIADVLAISASSIRDPKQLRKDAKRLIAAARPRGTRILFGGGGRWPEIPEPHARPSDFRALHEWLS